MYSNLIGVEFTYLSEVSVHLFIKECSLLVFLLDFMPLNCGFRAAMHAGQAPQLPSAAHQFVISE